MKASEFYLNDRNQLVVKHKKETVLIMDFQEIDTVFVRDYDKFKEQIK